MKPYFARVLSIYMIAIAGCNSNHPEIVTGRIHPEQEWISNLIEANERTPLMRLAVPDTINKEKARLHSIDPIVQIGKIEEDSKLMFGYIEDLAVDKKNKRIFILDARYNEIRAFDYNGVFLFAVGGPGVAPGELQYPQAIDFDDKNNTLITLDRNRSVQIYSVSDTSIAYSSSFKVDFPPWDTCVMNGHVFARGYSEEVKSTVLKYRLDGTRVGSFGIYYDSENPFVRQTLSPRGQVVCNRESNTLLVSIDHIPVFFIYDEEGTDLRRIYLDAFDPIDIIEGVSPDGRPTLEYTAPKKGENILSRFFTHGSDFFVQYFTVEQKGGRHLFKFDPNAETGEYMGTLGEVTFDIDLTQGYLFAASNRPYPRVFVFDISI